MPTSASTLVRTAVTTIANGDTTLQSLCGRTTRILVPWRTAAGATKPVIAYLLSANVRTGGKGDRRRVQLLTAAFAEGNGARTKVEALTQRLREILTPDAFLAQGLDAEVIEATDREGADEDITTPTSIERHDLDLLIRASAPL